MQSFGKGNYLQQGSHFTYLKKEKSLQNIFKDIDCKTNRKAASETESRSSHAARAEAASGFPDSWGPIYC